MQQKIAESKKAREEKEKQEDKPIVACEATKNRGNQNFRAVIATLAQMATQEELWFSLAWAFLVLMATAPDIQAIIAFPILQTIIFFFTQLALSSQTNCALFLHCALKQPLQHRLFKKVQQDCSSQTQMKNQKATTLGEKTVDNNAKNAFLFLLLIWKFHCNIDFWIQKNVSSVSP